MWKESREPSGDRFTRPETVSVGSHEDSGDEEDEYAFTSRREKQIGTIDDRHRFSPNEFYKNNRELLPSWPAEGSSLIYDAQKNTLYRDVEVPGPLVSESLDFLPLKLSNASDEPIEGHFSIELTPSATTKETAVAALALQYQQETIILATATVPSVFRRANVKTGSFNNVTGTYATEAAYRAGATTNASGETSVTVTVPGKFSSSVRSDASSLVLDGISAPASKTPEVSHEPIVAGKTIAIDGNFEDWRNVAGTDDRPKED